jgi:hypothetical protein
VCIASLSAEFSLSVVETVLYEAMVPNIYLCLGVVRSFCVVGISVSPCSCLCIRLDIGRRLVDYGSDGATCLREEEVIDLFDQAHMNRQHQCWEERGRGRVLEEDRWDDRWSDRQDGKYRLRIGRNRGR